MTSIRHRVGPPATLKPTVRTVLRPVVCGAVTNRNVWRPTPTLPHLSMDNVWSGRQTNQSVLVSTTTENLSTELDKRHILNDNAKLKYL